MEKLTRLKRNFIWMHESFIYGINISQIRLWSFPILFVWQHFVVQIGKRNNTNFSIPTFGEENEIWSLTQNSSTRSVKKSIFSSSECKHQISDLNQQGKASNQVLKSTFLPTFLSERKQRRERERDAQIIKINI